MQLSHYQEDVRDWCRFDRGDAFVAAAAGSGKTTLLSRVVAPELPRGEALFLAFNRHIVKELAERLPGTAVSTIHSAAYAALRGALRGARVSEFKYKDLVRDYLREFPLPRIPGLTDAQAREREGAYAGQVVELVGKVQATLTDARDAGALRALTSHFDIDVEDHRHAGAAVPAILDRGEQLARDRGIVSFSDQLWLPVLWRLPMKQFAWVLVDEAQDLSPAQLEAVMRMRKPGGRMLFCGDRYQALYGFAGADSASVDTIIKRTSAAELPLSICYRCPRTHIDLAQEVVPHIEPAPDAIDGEVRTIDTDDLVAHVAPGDLIICRVTAPLIGACFELIAAGMNARVRGRDIGKGLAGVLRRAAAAFPGDKPEVALVRFLEDQVRGLAAHPDAQMRINRLQDQVAGLQAIHRRAQPSTVEAWIAAVESIFVEDRASITLSTVHGAKGLEADRVFILAPEKMPHPLARLAWQRQQEANALYVALTRAKRSLFFVKEPA